MEDNLLINSFFKFSIFSPPHCKIFPTFTLDTSALTIVCLEQFGHQISIFTVFQAAPTISTSFSQTHAPQSGHLKFCIKESTIDFNIW
jgi:hypothetical protein